MNKWKYATLTENEKIRRISQGDGDLYKSEIKNARAYASLLKDNGIDTSSADSYISKLNEAADACGAVKTETDDGQKDGSEKPKYLQGEQNDSMLYILGELEKAYDSYTSQRDSLKEQAKKAKDAVLEKLHDDGYSADGQKGKKILDEVTRLYEDKLTALDKKYRPGIEKASKILGLLSKNAL